MNERLMELAERVETKEIGYYFFDRKKFAEFIVRECADLFKVEFGDEKLTGNDASWLLKKHFGIKDE